eukprot:CAMPEP_0170497810 /NCGR_PEP_ID=MMETSP0208-20121228/25853_1 /TAXON_ID=197538 /ORGANISM="Strombidium inclinatum, Strain S3" /LENGTH=104 /DNA_ID=CAMNT_0010774751 /DNA_START=979 /DNA_END=1293 /DNA_ORIENTATION=-
MTPDGKMGKKKDYQKVFEDNRPEDKILEEDELSITDSKMSESSNHSIRVTHHSKHNKVTLQDEHFDKDGHHLGTFNLQITSGSDISRKSRKSRKAATKRPSKTH